MKRVRLGGQDAQVARQVIKTARGAMKPAAQSGARVGITTFLKNSIRDGAPFAPPRVATAVPKNTAKRALSFGRQCHRLVEAFVEKGKVPPASEKIVNKWARNIIRVLCEAKIGKAPGASRLGEPRPRVC
jgi:hypothetical protein